MPVFVGVDLVEIDRLKKVFEKHRERFKERIFTPHEIEECEKRRNYEECYAARFAAKEAFSKAIGTGMRNGVRFRDIEVLNLPSGKPILRLYGRAAEIAGDAFIDVSLTHTEHLAVAVVVLERRNDG